MNIIQVQNRLKGVTDDALIQYVENPTGEVPTYLALGEIGRREDMRKQYQASQAEQPQKTVAEEMVAQLSTPTGIGALTNNMGPEMPPEEVMSTSETISETGVANLPIDMPQNFERGGIVGYAPGGEVLEGIDVNPNSVFPFGREVSEVYGMLEEPQVADYKDDLEKRKAAFGIDNKYYDDERTAIQEEKDLIAKRREGLGPDFAIRAGLGIMRGKDQNFFTNVAQGLAPAFEQYEKDDDTLIKEEKLSRKEDRLLNKMKRAEDIGDMKGFEAYGKEVRATQLKLIELEIDKATKLAAASAASGTTQGKAMEAAIKYSLDEMKVRYPEGENLPFYKNPDGWAKERAAIQKQKYDEILTGKVSDTQVPKKGYNPSPSQPTEFVEVTTKEQIEALDPGTRYKMPDGTFNIR
jgi:hypothetical protein